MKTLLASILLVCLLIKASSVLGQNVSVVEYMYRYNSHLTPIDNLRKNVLAHVNIVRLLKGKSEMVVFPDDSLCPASGSDAIYFTLPPPSYADPSLDNKVLKQISDAAKSSGIYVVISFPERFGNQRYSTSLVFRRNGTVAARYRKYYVSGDEIDRPSTPDISYFDTDFGVRFGLFSSNDIAYQSPALDLINQGVKFFVYPTSWTSSLPFFVSNQVQQSWSWTHDVTLLAAGLNRVTQSQTGSGIFRGRKGHLTSVPIKYYMSNLPTTMIITGGLLQNYMNPGRSKVNTNQDFFTLDRLFMRSHNIATNLNPSFSKSNTEYVADKSSGLVLDSSSFRSYKTNLLAPDRNCVYQTSGYTEFYRCEILQNLCHRNVCCQFDVTVDYYLCGSPCQADNFLSSVTTDDSFYLFRYRLAVLDGIDSPWNGGDSLGLQVCSIVPCLNDDVSTCGKKPDPSKYKTYVYSIRGHSARIWAQSVTKVNISGVFTKNSSTMMMPSLILGEMEPSVVEYNRFGLLSNHFFYEESDNTSKLLLPEDMRNLGAVAIINRVFSRDGFASSSQSQVPSSLILGIVLTTALYTMFRCCFIIQTRTIVV